MAFSAAFVVAAPDGSALLAQPDFWGVHPITECPARPVSELIVWLKFLLSGRVIE